MSNTPKDLKYAVTHEWLREEAGNIAVVGISDFAQEQLGDIVFVELPDLESIVAAGDAIAVVESVKSASDLYAPVSGEVVEINEALIDNPEKINEDPYEDGWLFKIKMTEEDDLKELLDAEAYVDQCEDE